jgi:Toprim-like/DNA primase catalytic core, N-terminal domain/CHC2 zinc finger
LPRSLSENIARLERGGGRRRRDSFHKWRKYVNVIDFLENMEVANISQSTADEVEFSCPFPDHTHGDENPSAYMNDGSKDPNLTTAWTCYGCKRGGNAITFLSEHDGITKQEASALLKAHYARGYIAPKYGSISKEFEMRRRTVTTVTELPKLGIEELKRFDVDWGYYAEEHRDQPDVAYMLDRGFTPATLDEWGIGYDYDSQRITIPVCDADGNLVGFKGRAWKKNARPKYLVLGDKEGRKQRYGFPVYEKSLVVYGLDRCAGFESLVLVEGEIDVISLDVMGLHAICTGGSSMSTAQARLIRQYCDEVVLFFDSDKAGRNAIYGYDKQDGEHKPGILEQLEPFVRVRVVGRHRFDPNDYLVRGERDRVRRLVASATPSHLL